MAPTENSTPSALVDEADGDTIRAWRLADRRDRPEEYLAAIGVSGHLCRASFETFDATLPGKGPAFRAVLAHADGRGTKPGVFLYGSAGNGKTHLAVAWVRKGLLDGKWMENALNPFIPTAALPGLVPVLWETVGELLRRARAACRAADGPTELALLDPLRRAEVLVLDDIGVKTLSEWGEEFLLAIFDSRHSRKLPTLVTSNVRPEGLDAVVFERIRSRVLELCEAVEVGGKDMRLAE